MCHKDGQELEEKPVFSALTGRMNLFPAWKRRSPGEEKAKARVSLVCWSRTSPHPTPQSAPGLEGGGEPPPTTGWSLKSRQPVPLSQVMCQQEASPGKHASVPLGVEATAPAASGYCAAASATVLTHPSTGGQTGIGFLSLLRQVSENLSD